MRPGSRITNQLGNGLSGWYPSTSSNEGLFPPSTTTASPHGLSANPLITPIVPLAATPIVPYTQRPLEIIPSNFRSTLDLSDNRLLTLPARTTPTIRTIQTLASRRTTTSPPVTRPVTLFPWNPEQTTTSTTTTTISSTAQSVTTIATTTTGADRTRATARQTARPSEPHASTLRTKPTSIYTHAHTLPTATTQVPWWISIRSSTPQGGVPYTTTTTSRTTGIENTDRGQRLSSTANGLIPTSKGPIIYTTPLTADVHGTTSVQPESHGQTRGTTLSSSGKSFTTAAGYSRFTNQPWTPSRTGTTNVPPFHETLPAIMTLPTGSGSAGLTSTLAPWRPSQGKTPVNNHIGTTRGTTAIEPDVRTLWTNHPNSVLEREFPTLGPPATTKTPSITGLYSSATAKIPVIPGTSRSPNRSSRYPVITGSITTGSTPISNYINRSVHNETHNGNSRFTIGFSTTKVARKTAVVQTTNGYRKITTTTAGL